MPSPKPSSSNKNLLLSLFCGVGGLDIGFEKLGFNVGLAFDIRPESIKTYNHNRATSHGHAKDVCDLTLSELDKLFGAEFKPIGIIGGPPCQGFSIANVHKKRVDIRNKLAFSYAKLLGELNQRNPVHFFVFENVKGLVTQHKSRFEKIKTAFNKAGFRTSVVTLNANSFGVPQNRERLIIVGLNKDLYPDSSWNPPLPNHEGLTVRDAIAGLAEPTFFKKGLSSSEIPLHPNHWCMAPKSKKFSQGKLIEGESFGRSFRTIRWDKPSPTVAYGNREVHVHPSGKRRLSVYEAMLLQGFPNKYQLLGNLSQQITQVSEAVPPPLSEALAKSIKLRLVQLCL